MHVPVGVTPVGLCVFWRPGESLIWETRGCSLVPSESDINKTTCECDHLTTFASLMDPYDSSVSEFPTHFLSSHFTQARSRLGLHVRTALVKVDRFTQRLVLVASLSHVCSQKRGEQALGWVLGRTSRVRSRASGANRECTGDEWSGLLAGYSKNCFRSEEK